MATLASACGDSGGTTVVVRSLPDTSDVEAGPLEGVWLRVGDETARTDGDGEARFAVESGRVRVCELGSSETPTPSPQTCLEESVPAGGRIELRISDLGLTMGTG
jgi:hypothetical protein